MTHPRFRPCSRSRALALILLAPGALPAQEEASAPEPEIIELSPFVVETTRDVGYNASSSTVGGRLSVALIDTAVQITALNRQFLDDIGAASYGEAINWAPNTNNESAAGIAPGNEAFGDNRVSFRGLQGNFNTRNFFRTYVNLDSFNLERADFARGPNSLVAGDAGLVGSVNLSSKAPLAKDAYELQVRVSDAGGHRVVLDANVAAGDRFGVRAGLLTDKSPGWRDRELHERDGVFGVASWRPFRRTTLLVEGETGTITRTLGFPMLDGMSQWNGTTVVGTPATTGQYGGGVQRLGSTRLVYNPADPSAGVLDYRNFGETTGTTAQIIAGGSFPWATNTRTVVPTNAYHLNAPNAYSIQDYEVASATLLQQVNQDLYLEAAVQWAEQYRTVDQVFFNVLRQDVNQQLPGGAANPYFGRYYAEQGWVRQVVQGNEAIEARASAAWFLDTSLTRQRFLLAVNAFDEDFNYLQDGLQRVGGTTADVTNAANRIGIRRYEGQLDLASSFPVLGSPMPGGGTAQWVRLDDRGSNVTKVFYQAAANGSWFKNDWLKTLVGWRRDSIETSSAGRIQDPVTRIATGRGPYVVSLEDDFDLLTYSAVVRATSWISLFAGYAETFTNPVERLLIDGSRTGGSFGEGTELGVRLQSPDNRFSASLNYYDSELDSPSVNGESARINQIWTDLGRSDSLVSYSDRRVNEAKGWEFQAGLNPVEGWNIMFNAALPETAIIEELPDTKAYVAANRQTWTTLLAGVTDAALRTTIQNNISNVENRIASAVEGRKVDGSLDYTANLFTTYTFGGGRLKGLQVGGGANVRGDRLVGNRPGNPFDYVESKGYTLFTAMLGYSTRVGRANVRFQLNVQNLLDQEIVREEAYSTYTVNGTPYFVPSAWAIVSPRTWTLQATVRF